MSALNPLRSFSKDILNPVVRHVAAWLPGFTLLEYVGRTSGRTYRIPVKLFRHGPDCVVAMTYGTDVQWVKNVMAAGGCVIRIRHRTARLANPRSVVDPSRALLPRYARPIMRFLRVTEFVTMQAADDQP